MPTNEGYSNEIKTFGKHQKNHLVAKTYSLWLLLLNLTFNLYHYPHYRKIRIVVQKIKFKIGLELFEIFLIDLLGT